MSEEAPPEVVYVQRKTDGMHYEPLPKQIRLHESNSRYRGYIGGIGSGKTLWLVMDFFKLAVEYPGTIWVLTAPTYPMLRDSTLKTFNEWVPDAALKKWHASEKYWEFWNGSEIWFRSSNDPDSLRGPNINGFGMDEAAKDKLATWNIMIGRIRRVTKYKNGRVAPNVGAAVSTPKGYNWLWQVFVKRKTELHHLEKTSSKENIHLPPDFVPSLEAQYSGVFYEQEVMGEFRAHEGLVYSKFDRDIHVRKPSESIDRHKYFLGSIDWGYANPMVGLIASVDGDKRMHFLEEIYQRRMTIPEFAEKLREMEKSAAAAMKVEYPFDITYWCDPSDTSIGAGSMMQALRDMGFDIRKANNEIMSGINCVQKRLEMNPDGLPRLMVTESCANTISEFEQYSYDEYDADKPFKDKPMKMNDHAMDAMRYMAMSLEGGDRIVSLEPGGFLL